MNLDAVTVFVRVAEALSFTTAARNLGMPKSTVSKRVMELEQHLGTQLLIRSTRRLTLTETGRRYFEVSQHAIGTLQRAEKEVLDWNSMPQGTLCVGVPTLLGQFSLARVIEEYLRTCPRVNVELCLNDSPNADDFDIVLKWAEPSRRRTSRGRHFSSDSMVFCASPDYLTRHGTPKHPRELANHDLISFVDGDPGAVWNMSQGSKRLALPVQCRLKANSLIVAIDATLAGLGIGQLPLGLVNPHILDGALVRVLSQWNGRQNVMRLFCGAKKPLPLRTKIFLDLLEQNANLELCSLDVPTFSPTPRLARSAARRSREMEDNRSG